MGCHAFSFFLFFLFLQRLNLVPRSYIILDFSFAHFCHNSNVTHFYPRNHKCQFDIKCGSLSMQAAPKISYLQISCDETSLGGNTVIRFGILPLWSSTLRTRNPYVILNKFRTRFIDLLSYSDQQNLQHLRRSSLAVNYCSFKNGTLVLVSSVVIIFLP